MAQKHKVGHPGHKGHYSQHMLLAHAKFNIFEHNDKSMPTYAPQSLTFVLKLWQKSFQYLALFGVSLINHTCLYQNLFFNDMAPPPIFTLQENKWVAPPAVGFPLWKFVSCACGLC